MEGQETITQPQITEETIIQPTEATTETQTPPQVSEENSPANVDDNTAPQDTQTTTQTPVSQEEVEQLKAKLNEYQLTDAELTQLKQRIGVDNVDYNTAQIQHTLGLIQNQAQQEYIALCNRYGIDSRPEMVEQSAKQLEEKDPRSFYAFQRSLDSIYGNMNMRLNEVRNYSVAREVNSFYNDNKAVLDASPMISNVINEYISQTPPEYLNRRTLDVYLERARQIYTEAYNVGLQAAKHKEQLDPNKILNNSTMATNQTTYPMGSSTYTRDQIANMSLEEFGKHEKEIMAQMMSGQIK